MYRKTSSSTLTVLLFCIVSASARPIQLAQWQWIDPAGLLHEYNVFNFAGASWECSNNRITDTWHMATITSANEQQALITGLKGLSGEFWLGGYQSNRNAGPEDNWAWCTGEPWGFKHWAPGEPNDAHGSGSEQHMAVWSKWGTSRWLWNDEGHLPNIRGYIAERTTTREVPEPGQFPLFAAGIIAIACMIRKKKCP